METCRVTVNATLVFEVLAESPAVAREQVGKLLINSYSPRYLDLPGKPRLLVGVILSASCKT